MIKSDKNFLQTLNDIIDNGAWSTNPRTKWKDGSPATYTSVKQQAFDYDIFENEFPIITLRKTALKGAFYDMEAIYIKQTNVIEEMNPVIRPWWEPFVVGGEGNNRHIGQTYGHTVKRYDLMNKLLDGMEKNPESRRHIINLWQEQQMIDDPAALVPCAYLTEWSVKVDENENYVDLTLIQRSQDFLMTASINPIQYVFLGMMVCNHLTFVTGKKHWLSNFHYNVNDVHIYNRHVEAALYLLSVNPLAQQPTVKLICPPKDFYSHKWEDFEFENIEDIPTLPFKLEIAI